MKVQLAWATRVRHIAVDGKVLCEPKTKSAGYSVSNGQYNTLALSGLPTYSKSSDDSDRSHGDGTIKFAPLDQQDFKIILRSICKKCQKRYAKLFK